MRWRTLLPPHASKAPRATWQATTPSARNPVAERSRGSSRSTVITPGYRISATRAPVLLLRRKPRAGKRVSGEARRPDYGTQPPRACLSAIPVPAQRRCHSHRHPGFAVSALVVTVLLHGLAPPPIHAQDTWPVVRTVEVSPATLTLSPGQTLSYRVRLTAPPTADGWWVMIHVDGDVRGDLTTRVSVGFRRSVGGSTRTTGTNGVG